MAGHAGHTHGPTSGRKLWISLAVTLVFVAFEAIAGWRSHSLALISDAGHNLSDAVALGLAAFAIWISQRPATARRTFGYHRVAILTALFNAVTLVVLAAFIAIEAWQRFLKPEPVASDMMIWVALIAVLMNTVIAVALSGDAKHSLNSRAAYVHMAGDALSSLAVAVAGVIVHFTGWRYADPLVSVLIAAFIAYTAWGIVRDATDILLENTPRDVDVDALVASIHSVPMVQNVHDLHIWTVGDGLHFLSCHVALPADATLTECASIVQTIGDKLHDEFNIGHATIQTEVIGLCHRGDQAGLHCEQEPHLHSHHDHAH
jgi:cobalt-zinc-cadmium efflux system protein